MVRVAQQGRDFCISGCAGEMCRPRGDQVSRYKRLYILGLGVGLLVVILHSPQVLSQNTQEWVATLKSVEGTVEARRAAQNEWLPAALNDTFTIGDSIRVLACRRAASPKTSRNVRAHPILTADRNGVPCRRLLPRIAAKTSHPAARASPSYPPVSAPPRFPVKKRAGRQ